MTNVIYLLKLEWLKVKTYAPFLILMGMYALLLPSFMSVGKNFPIPEQLGGVNAYYMFPAVWGSLAYVGNWLAYFIMGFVGVLIVTNEFSNRTLRQNIISGISRADFYLSKVYFMLLISLAATLYYAFVAVVFGLINTETIFASRVVENIDFIPRYFLMCMAYMSMGFVLGVLFRKTGIALFLYFAYNMFIEKIIRYTLIRKVFGMKAMLFAPANAVSDLAPFPIPKMAKSFVDGAKFQLFLTPLEATFTALVFTILFLYFAYYLLKTKDL